MLGQLLYSHRLYYGAFDPRLAALCLLLPCCDPAWSYSIPGAASRDLDERQFELSSAVPGVSVWAGASVFTDTLALNVTVENASGKPLPVNARADVRDAAGHALSSYAASPWKGCSTGASGEVLVGAGATCSATFAYQVHPIGGGCGHYVRANPVLDTVSLSLRDAVDDHSLAEGRFQRQ